MYAITVVIFFLLGVPAAVGQPLPIFDAHIHYSEGTWERMPPKEAIGLLRKAGVARALVSSSNDDGTQKLYAAAPEIILPSLGGRRCAHCPSQWRSAVRRDARAAQAMTHNPG